MKTVLFAFAFLLSTSTAYAKALTGFCELNNGAKKVKVPLAISANPTKNYGAALIGQSIGPFQVSIQMGHAMTPEGFGRIKDDRLTVSIDTAASTAAFGIPTLAFVRGEAVEVWGESPTNRQVHLRCEIAVK